MMESLSEMYGLMPLGLWLAVGGIAVLFGLLLIANRVIDRIVAEPDEPGGRHPVRKQMD
jgi:hypothetical protein